jgi:hypothetical protein
MRAMTAAVAGAVLVLGACGAADKSGVAAGRPKLPVAGAPAGATAAARDSATAPGADLMAYPARPIEYRLAAGAKAPATAAPAYKLERADVDAGTARKLAAAFGMQAESERGSGQSFSVRDGSAQVQVDGGAVPSWNYSRDMEGSVSSDVAVACAPDGGCPEPGWAPAPPVAGLPSAAEAEAKARALLERAGVDLEHVAVDAPQPGETQSRTVAFSPLVDGRSVVGLTTSVTFGENARVEYANGYLGRFEKVGDYPLVSLAQAVERLRSGFVGDGGPRPMAADTPAIAEANSGGGSSAGSPGSAGSGGAATEVPPAPPASDAVPVDPAVPPTAPTTYPPQVVEITGARVVLMLAYPTCPDDDAFLVPAFAFAPEEAGTVMAVEDDSLAGGAAGSSDRKAAEPCPGVQPAPAPVGKPEPAPLPTERPDTPAPVPAPTVTSQ